MIYLILGLGYVLSFEIYSSRHSLRSISLGYCYGYVGTRKIKFEGKHIFGWNDKYDWLTSVPSSSLAELELTFVTLYNYPSTCAS